ncbi:hypothetical protein ACHAXS_004247, partial [Conticribra weissflogii]
VSVNSHFFFAARPNASLLRKITFYNKNSRCSTLGCRNDGLTYGTFQYCWHIIDKRFSLFILFGIVHNNGAYSKLHKSKIIRHKECTCHKFVPYSLFCYAQLRLSH